MNIKEIEQEIKLIDKQLDILESPVIFNFRCDDCGAKVGKYCVEGFFKRKADVIHTNRQERWAEERDKYDRVYNHLKEKLSELIEQKLEYYRIKNEEAEKIRKEKLDNIILETITEETSKHREIQIYINDNKFRILYTTNVIINTQKARKM